MNATAPKPRELERGNGLDESKNPETLAEDIEKAKRKADLATENLEVSIEDPEMVAFGSLDTQDFSKNTPELQRKIKMYWLELIVEFLSQNKTPLKDLIKYPDLFFIVPRSSKKDQIAIEQLRTVILTKGLQWNTLCQEAELLINEGHDEESVLERTIAYAKENPGKAGLAAVAGVGILLLGVHFVKKRIIGAISGFVGDGDVGKFVKEKLNSSGGGLGSIVINSLIATAVIWGATKAWDKVRDSANQAGVLKETLNQYEDRMRTAIKGGKENVEQSLEAFVEEHHIIPKYLRKAGEHLDINVVLLAYLSGSRSLNELRSEVEMKKKSAVQLGLSTEEGLLNFLESKEAQTALEVHYGNAPIGDKPLGELFEVLDAASFFDPIDPKAAKEGEAVPATDVLAEEGETQDKDSTEENADAIEANKGLETSVDATRFPRTAKIWNEIDGNPQNYEEGKVLACNLIEASIKDSFSLILDPSGFIYLIKKGSIIVKKAGNNLIEALQDIVLVSSGEKHIIDLLNKKSDKYRDLDQILILGGGTTVGAVHAARLGRNVWWGALKGGATASEKIVIAALNTSTTTAIDLGRLGILVGEKACWARGDMEGVLRARVAGLELDRKVLAYYRRLEAYGARVGWGARKVIGSVYESLSPDRSAKKVIEHAIRCREALESLGITHLEGDPLPDASLLRSDAGARNTFMDRVSRFDANAHRVTGLTTLRAHAAAERHRKSPAGRTAALDRIGVDPALRSRLPHLGNSPSGDTLNVTEKELDEILRRAEASPKAKAILLEILSDADSLKLGNSIIAVFKNAGHTVNIWFILKDIYDFRKADNKTDFLAKTTTITLSVALVVKGIQHGATKGGNPIVGGLIGALAAVGIGMGGGLAWEKYITPKLERRYPDRNEFWKTKPGEKIADAVGVGLGGMGLDQLGYYTGGFNILNRVDEDTDPFEYLTESARMLKKEPGIIANAVNAVGIKHEGIQRIVETPMPGSIDGLLGVAGIFGVSVQEIPFHSFEEFLDRSDAWKKDLEEGLSKSTEPVERDEIKKQLAKAESYLNGSWAISKQIELMSQSIALDEAKEKFRKELKHNKDRGEASVKLLDEIFTQLESGDRHITEKPEWLELWQFLADQKVEIENPNGDDIELSFYDLAAALTMNRDEQKKMENIITLYQSKGFLKPEEEIRDNEDLEAKEDPEIIS